MNVNKENSNLVYLGEYIELCDERNGDETYTLDDVRGISILKKLIPTKADMQDVLLTPYKLLKPREFSYVTVTSRNGGKISLAINDSDETYLVSSSYVVFRSKNIEELLPEYLYILLSREEFDRLSRFSSWGSARETFDWNEFCRIEIPLPNIGIQKELVDTYKGLKALAEHNEALIQPLTQACQAYIVDCKKKYPEVELGGYIEEYDKRNSDKKIKAVKSVSVTKEFKETGAKVNKDELEGYKLVPPRHISYVQTTKNEKCFANALNTTNETYVVTQVNKVIRSKDESILNIGFLHIIFKSVEFDRFAIFNSWGSARETFDWSELCRVRIPLPSPEVQKAIVNLYNCAEEAKKIAAEAREKMKFLCPALVQKAING
jgi:type I restriction enzyme S subunit